MRNGNAITAELEQKFQDEELNQVASAHRRTNWSVFVGLIIIGLITLMAIIGPSIAPKDPVEEVMIVKIEGEWYVPPFPLFTPGYPLGSDQFGRDLWSRLLWGIRPTLIMVVVVAVVRLILGVLIGILAGWLNNRFGRLLNNLIEGAVAIPVLLVALGAIAIVGTELGIWAFVIGFSLTGWVETAQQVREQTKIIRGQTYIEAARALGSSSRFILSNHVIRQILPMILMLFAFELSSTLMTTAGLGFLGYYIGGDRYIEVSDFVVRRLSGMPELGQMLATSWATLTQPWAMVAVGTTIFVTILGFNLIGEGLRDSLDIVSARRGFFWQARWRANFWLDQHIVYPLRQYFMRPNIRMAAFVMLLAALLWFGGVQFLWPKIHLVLEGLPGQGISAAFADAIASQTPEGTAVTAAESAVATSTPQPVYNPQVIWEHQAAPGFAAGVVYDPDRLTIYGPTTDKRLLAFSLNGEQLWEAGLPAKPFTGDPIVTLDGIILVADADAGVSAISPEGQLMWHFASTKAPITTSGMVMDDAGTIYYVVSDYSKGYIQAISTEGEDLWSLQVRTSNFYFPLNISRDGRYLFLREEIIDTVERSTVEVETDLIASRYLGGRDGDIYMLSNQNLMRVDIGQQPLKVIDSFNWDYTASGVIFSSQQAPIQAVVSPDHIARYFYTTPGGSSSLVWLKKDQGLIGKVTAKFSGGEIIAEKDFMNIFVCGGRSFQPEPLTCGMLSSNAEDPLWMIELGDNGPALGGFWVRDTVYFSTANGTLYALSPEGSESVSNASPPVSQTNSKIGVAWSFPLSYEIEFGPYQMDDESVLMVLDAGELLILNPDGTERLRKAIYKPWYELVGGRGGSITFYPHVLDGQILISFSQDPSVYAQDTEGNLLWEVPLVNPLDDPPYQIDNSTIYLVDKAGILYQVGGSGVNWEFTPEVTDHPASGLAVGPDGTIYYTLTDMAKGYLQAVTAAGAPIWSSEIHTTAFYDPVLVSADGQYLFIKNEIYKSSDGQFLDIDFGIPVTEFIVGRDGKNYLRSEQSIISWDIDSSGFEILSTATTPAISPNTFRGSVEVDANSIIWIYLFSRSGFTVSFLMPDGTSLGEFTQAPDDLVYKLDFEHSSISLCRYEGGMLSCGSYDSRTDIYSVKFSLQDLPDFLVSGWRATGEDYVFIHTQDDQLLKVILK